MQQLLIGCDWGTSSFRLRLFDSLSLEIIDEVVSDKGISKVYGEWQIASSSDGRIRKSDFFRQYLEQQVGLLSEKSGVDLSAVNVVISGMASSSIGMEELPYATIPFAIDGSSAIVKRIGATDLFPHEMNLISGVRTDNDVMRGEETQLIGLVALMEQRENKLSESVFIFPGTHSKHIRLRHGQMINFNTFMTGELFNIMCNHSILKDSVEKSQVGKFTEAEKEAFIRGVLKATETNILNSLFTVRTNQLFNKLSREQNAFYLSGLLIGEELKYLLEDKSAPLVLCSGSNLYEFYKMAFDGLDLSNRTTFIAVDIIDKAALAGQHLVYQNHVLNKQAK